MVLFGVVWCSVVWCGVVWCGVFLGLDERGEEEGLVFGRSTVKNSERRIDMSK